MNRGSTSGTNPPYGATPSASQLIVRVHFNQRLIGGNERRCPCVGGASAPPTHGQPRSFPPLSRWLKWTLTMSCAALGVAPYVGFVPEVLPLFKGQPQTGAELGSAGETHYQFVSMINYEIASHHQLAYCYSRPLDRLLAGQSASQPASRPSLVMTTIQKH